MSRRTHVGTDNTIDLRQRRRSRDTWQGAERRPPEDRFPRLAVVRPVARTTLTPGTVVWAHVPFEEVDGWKLRPVVVHQRRGREVTVFPGTTSDKRHLDRWAYRELTDLESAGLPRATGIELAAVTIDVTEIVSVARALGPEDHCAILGRPAGAIQQPLGEAA